MGKRLPKLDARLAAIAAMVRPGARCADIGTDHGYLIARLAAEDRIAFGYACDVNQKPLDRAASALSAHGVADRVKTMLCDGLSGLRSDAVDDIVIAGMGGELIWAIIDAQDWTRDPRLRFLLQPMTRAERLRTRLYEHGFAILRETAVVSGGFPYAVMEVAYTGERREIPPAFAYTGLLLGQENDAARRYVAKVARLIREKADGLRAIGEASADCEKLLKELESGNEYDGK